MTFRDNEDSGHYTREAAKNRWRRGYRQCRLTLLAEYPDFLLWQAVQHILTDSKIRGEQRTRIATQPVGQRDFLIDAAVEQNQNSGRFITHLLDKCP